MFTDFSDEKSRHYLSDKTDLLERPVNCETTEFPKLSVPCAAAYGAFPRERAVSERNEKK